MFNVAVIVASDKGYKGERVDKSSSIISKFVEQLGGSVKSVKIVPDEREIIASELKELSALREIDIILTTGGTGLSSRDVTPEATEEIIERKVSGISEAMRIQTLKNTPYAMLSRGQAGIRGNTVIINLPGSPKAVKECLEVIGEVFVHMVEVLRNENLECGEDAELK